MSGAYRNNIDNSLHHPYYQTFERRIQRFKNWNGSVDPRLLARAGFFFTGMHKICFNMYFRAVVSFYISFITGAFWTHIEYIKRPVFKYLFILCVHVYVRVDRDDYVICFACGIGVKNWDSSCDPWSEHQKHKPKCPFLRTGLKAYRREIEVNTKLL